MSIRKCDMACGSIRSWTTYLWLFGRLYEMVSLGGDEMRGLADYEEIKRFVDKGLVGAAAHITAIYV